MPAIVFLCTWRSMMKLCRRVFHRPSIRSTKPSLMSSGALKMNGNQTEDRPQHVRLAPAVFGERRFLDFHAEHATMQQFLWRLYAYIHLQRLASLLTAKTSTLNRFVFVVQPPKSKFEREECIYRYIYTYIKLLHQVVSFLQAKTRWGIFRLDVIITYIFCNFRQTKGWLG